MIPEIATQSLIKENPLHLWRLIGQSHLMTNWMNLQKRQELRLKYLKWAGMISISGALAGMGGFVYSLTTANCTANGDVAGFGFLALAVMIFGNWKPLNIAGASLLFGLFKCIAASYSSIDINGDGVYLLADLGISAHFYRMLPYLITLIVLAFTSKNSRAPKAEGIPYDKSTR